MKHNSIDNLKIIKSEVELINKDTKIIAVSKTFPVETINPLIDFGHTHFGENKVQEALEKWTEIKNKNKDIKLHMVGKLQTNKVKFVLPLFDYIHSLDSLKLAEKISAEQKKKKFKPKIFIQLNLGKEVQKSGIDVEYFPEFYEKCKNDFELNIVGLMCLPPFNEDSKPFFLQMKKLTNKFNSNFELSMGMSNDYLSAVEFSSSYLRIGT